MMTVPPGAMKTLVGSPIAANAASHRWSSSSSLCGVWPESKSATARTRWNAGGSHADDGGADDHEKHGRGPAPV
jgi:hypothetical protein